MPSPRSAVRGSRLICIFPLAVLLGISAPATAGAGTSGQQAWVQHLPKVDMGRFWGDALEMAVSEKNSIFTTNGNSISKYDRAGRRLWTKSIGVAVGALAVGDEDSVFVSGGSVVTKIDREGRREWTKLLELGLSGQVNAMDVDENGDVYLAATTIVYPRSGNRWSVFTTIKVSADGRVVWTKEYRGPARTDEARAVAVAPDGSVVAAGSTDSGPRSNDFLIIKYTPAGDRQWARVYDRDGVDNQVSALAVDTAGNIYVSGTSADDRTWESKKTFLTVKYRPNGAFAWTKSFGIPQSYASAQLMGVGAAGNVFVGGFTRTVDWGYDMAVVKYDGDGEYLWHKRHKGLRRYNINMTGMVVGPRGSVFLTGVRTHYWGPGAMFITVKYDWRGKKQWVRRIPVDGYGGTSVMAADSLGDLYVLGQNSSGEDAFLTKYHP